MRKPRNRFPVLKQTMIAHLKAHPDQLLRYSEKDAAWFKKKYPEAFPENYIQSKHWN